MLDGSVKTVMVDDSKTVGELLVTICSRIGKGTHAELLDFVLFLIICLFFFSTPFGYLGNFEYIVTHWLWPSPKRVCSFSWFANPLTGVVNTWTSHWVTSESFYFKNNRSFQLKVMFQNHIIQSPAHGCDSVSASLIPRISPEDSWGQPVQFLGIFFSPSFC